MPARPDLEPDAVVMAPRRQIALAVVGLFSFAIGLPIARVLVGAPEFFLAHGLSAAQVLAFWLGVTLGLPIAAAAIAVLPLPGGRTLRAPIAAIGGGLGAAGLLQPISGWAAPFWIASIAVGLVAGAQLGRHRGLTETLAFGSIGCLLLAGWAVGPSRSGELIRSGTAAAVAVEAADPPPIVVLVFDEMPLTALLDLDLQIDADRFPNFAALADTSDWYRLGASASPNTAYAVPALLSGEVPDPGKVPVASAYPHNLFLQLANTHEVHAFESMTSLCPPAVCDAATTKPVAAPSLASDLAVVLQHALGTDDLRRSLPSIGTGWAGFDDVGGGHVEDGSARKLVFDRSTFGRETDGLLDVAGTTPSGVRPLALVAHATAPHAPWVTTPGGGRYPVTHPVGAEVVGGTLHWTGGEAGRRIGYQRLVLQVGALDEVLGRARAALEASGVWDDALVVVTADHGVQFEDGYWRSIERGGAEVSGVPMFVKRPGQRTGRVDDRAASNTDLLPTVLDIAGIASPTEFDGLDLEVDDVPSRRTGSFVQSSGARATPDQTLGALRSVVERRSRWIDPGGGWDAVYQAGVDVPVVGREAAWLGDAVPGGGSWSSPGPVGRQLVVEMDGVQGGDAGPVVVACAGTVVGAVPWDAVVDDVATAYLSADCDDADLSVAMLAPRGRVDLARVR